MNRNLHVIAPADIYTPGGVVTEIPLTCIADSGKVLPVKVSTVIIRIITSDPLTFEILTELGDFVFGVNEDDSIVLPGSKIYNPCTEETIYVTEYINDIVPFISCCNATQQFIEAAPPSEGGENIEALENRLVFYSLTEDAATALNGVIELSEEQEIDINWGDGSTEVLSGESIYNIAHVFNMPGSNGVSINFADGTKLTKFILQNANVTGVSGLELFTNLVELEISKSLLAELPVLPNSITKLIVACNPDISTIAALPTSLLYFDASNCGLTALPTLPVGLTDMYVPNNVIEDIPALPANIANLNVSDNALDVAELDSVLAEVVSQAIDNGLLELQDQTPLAEVDGPGAADITTLQGRGWVVNADIA
jgi:hypothetical protein